MEICAGLSEPSDAASCVRGTKVQNLLDRRVDVYVALIDDCGGFARASRPACYRWLGKTLSVLTDGRFARAGCPKLTTADARRQCAVGARSMNDALVTFS
jgi:hypothetical protein